MLWCHRRWPVGHPYNGHALNAHVLDGEGRWVQWNSHRLLFVLPLLPTYPPGEVIGSSLDAYASRSGGIASTRANAARAYNVSVLSSFRVGGNLLHRERHIIEHIV